jgi:hypothetical protein
MIKLSNKNALHLSKALVYGKIIARYPDGKEKSANYYVFTCLASFALREG